MPISPQLTQLLVDLKHIDLNESAQKLWQRSSKAQRQESAKSALLELQQCFEQNLIKAIQLRFALHDGQAKKLRFKKDRIRLLKQHGIDYLTVDGAQTAQVLAWICQSITYEDGLVTRDLHDAFPFWKEGFPMVQLDNVYLILAEDIQLHFQALIDELVTS